MSTAVITSGSLVGARELIAELGADPDSLAEQAGLLPRLFEEPDIFVQADRIVDFFELAAVACHCPDFGLRHARRLPMGVFWQLWIGMRTAQNMRAALEHYVRLYGLYTDGGSFHLEPEHDCVWMHYSILPLGRWGVTQLVNLTFAHLCLFIRETLRRRWFPRCVRLRVNPHDPTPYTAFFGPEIRFGEDHDAILIDRDTLCATMAVGGLEKPMREPGAARNTIKGPAVIVQVRALLAVLLRHGHFQIESLARSLGMSERTLQRRLSDAGTSYHELVDNVRADLAWRHLQRTNLSIAQVADLLGYQCQTAFSRAFRRWHGVTPRAARSNRTTSTDNSG